MAITNFKRLNSDDGGKAVPFEYVDVNSITANTYTILATDVGDILTFSNSNAVSVTVPTNASTPIPVGTIITMIQMGDGAIVIAPSSGVTIYREPSVVVTSPATISTRAKYSKIQLIKIGTNEWITEGYGFYVQQSSPSNPKTGDLWFW